MYNNTANYLGFCRPFVTDAKSLARETSHRGDDAGWAGTGIIHLSVLSNKDKDKLVLIVRSATLIKIWLKIIEK